MEHLGYQHVVYNVLKTQIQFGVYRFGDRLPTMEDACRIFGVSLTTIRAAYQFLKKDGLVTISKNIGVKVTKQYSEQEMEAHIQSFFASRRDVLIDLSHSMTLLFNQAQWIGFRNASPELLNSVEQFAPQQKLPLTYQMIQILQEVYGSLHNDLLMRLVWQVFMLYQAPFLSVAGNAVLSKIVDVPLLHIIDLCREKNWRELRAAVPSFQIQFASALQQFYDERIAFSPSAPQETFFWSSYKKTSQLCYSLSMELLISISRGVYPPGTCLPSARKLAKEKQVSLSTIRRTLTVLNSIGVTKSINGSGTQVLPQEQIAENCDFSKPAVRRHLVNFVQSLHILALSCRDVVQMTMTCESSALVQFKDRLQLLARTQKVDLAAYGILELITHLSPYQVVRTVYTELFQQLLWGYPLRGIPKETELLTSYYAPRHHHLIDSLTRFDPAGFATQLEELLLHELDDALALLAKLEISADGIQSPNLAADGA